MKFENLSFNMINDDGIEVICDITSVIPNPQNSNEPYVTYTDYMLDNNDEFLSYYGQIITENNKTKLKKIDDADLINKIIELSNDEIVKYVNKHVQENLS